MHVIYFHQYFSTPKGKSGIRSYEFARRLIEEGHTVTMVCGLDTAGSTGLTGPFVRGIRRGMVDGIDVIEIDLPYSNYFSFLKRTWVFLQFALRSVHIAWREKYDVLFATSTPLTAAIPGILMKVLRRKRFVFEVRDLWPELPREMGVITNPVVLGLMGALEWTAYKAADEIVALSPGILQGVLRFGKDPRRGTMIPNGCDLDLFTPDRSGRDTVQIPGVERDDTVAIFTGAHGIANGLDAVLDAARVLKARGSAKVKFVFVGDGREKPRLLQRVKEEGLDNCIFMDLVTKGELTKLIARADIGLMILANVPAFYYGTSPNKFFDYIASGLPVLNNYPGWLADMITEHQCGVAVEPNNPEAFADALVSLSSEPSRLERMAVNARTLAEQKFNRAHHAGEFVKVLERVADVPRANARSSRPVSLATGGQSNP